MTYSLHFDFKVHPKAGGDMFRGERLPPEHPAPDVWIRGVHGFGFEEHRKGRNARRGEEEPRCKVSRTVFRYTVLVFRLC